MPLTQKRADELLDKLAPRQGQRARELLPPQSIAERMYPKLKTDADRRREEALTKERK
jgi:hypothetical protein